MKLLYGALILITVCLFCRLGAGSIPFRAIVNKKQCETGLFMSLVSE